VIKLPIAGIVAAALLLGVAGQAGAGFIQLTNTSQLNAGDTTAIYAGTDGTHLDSPIVLPAGGNVLTFSDNPAVGFLRADQGNTWTGAFADGTKLLWNIDSTGSFYGGPDTITLANGVTEAGLQVQQDNAANTTFTAQVFNGATLGLTITVTVPAGTVPGPGNLGFIGFQATGGDVITKIVISSADASSSTFNNDFAIGPVVFGTPSVQTPEPSSVALLGLGLAAAACGLRRLARKAE
jgi:hypothetical protein